MKVKIMLGAGHIGIWMGRREEKAVISACKRHIEKIFSIVNRFKQFVDAYCDGNVEAAKQTAIEITTLEREADEIKESIIDELMESSLHPMDQDEIIRLILTADDIAAHLKSATRKMTYAHTSDVPEPIKNGLKDMVNSLIDEMVALIQTIKALEKNKGEVTAKAEITERIEEKIDDMRVDLLAKILDWGDVAEHVRDFVMVKEAVENIESASDKMEDTADVLRAIAILRGKK
ncbi:MAG: DUF47 family protein [Candidatus Methanomethylicia archaeon]|nr:DUF47 family protein [Candidatus Methanomethylicia archaeon]